MKTIDLTVLFVDTAPARIYLALLKKHGYQVKKIIALEIQSKSKKYNFARKLMGDFVANKMLQVYKKSFKTRCPVSLSEKCLEKNGLTRNCLKQSLESYTNNPVKTIRVNEINDVRLKEHLKSLRDNTILFTGGGFLKETMLSLTGKRFIHIHPGIVPDIKGADGLFWSLLISGKAGFSVFYMNKGIDTGDIIARQQFDVDLIGIPLDQYSNDEIYNTLLKFYDPCLRALTLITLLDSLYSLDKTKNKPEQPDLSNIYCENQNPGDGRTYFFMHKSLRDYVIDNLRKGKA